MVRFPCQSVRRFRLAVAKANKPDRQRERLATVIEHLGMWTTATVSVLHDGERAVYLVVVTARPVRVQAAADMAATTPFYAAKSFKRLG